MSRIIIQPLKNHWYGILFLLLMAGFTVTSCNSTDSDDEDAPSGPSKIEYSGSFVPSSTDVTTSAGGTATATFDPETGEVSFQITWQGLSTPVVDMHFHDNGPVIHGIEGWDEATSGSVSGTVTFTDDEADDLSAGDVYVQIHTEQYPGGEVVATLTQSGSTPNGGGDGDGGPDYDY